MTQLVLSIFDKTAMLWLCARAAAMHMGIAIQADSGLQQRLAVNIHEQAFCRTVA